MTYTIELNAETGNFHIVATKGKTRFVSEKGYVHERRAQSALDKLA